MNQQPVTRDQRLATKQLILFDIDGTLLLSGGAGEKALYQAFANFSGHKKGNVNFCFHGMTDLAIIRKIFVEQFHLQPTENDIDEIKKLYSKFLPDLLTESVNFVLLPYVKEVLDALSKRHDVALGLATGNFEKTGFEKLARGGIGHYFKFGGFAEDGEDRQDLTLAAVQKGKDYIGCEPEAVYVVGDTIHDVRCGQGAGAKVIAVATGPVGVAVLREAGADWVAEDLRTCLEVI